jgi:hypothetical protein
MRGLPRQGLAQKILGFGHQSIRKVEITNFKMNWLRMLQPSKLKACCYNITDIYGSTNSKYLIRIASSPLS